MTDGELEMDDEKKEKESEVAACAATALLRSLSG
jgi:hypothetical protein